jgi:hypothetical protein
LISLAVQAGAHAIFNTDHFASHPFARHNEIMSMTLLVLLVQGAIMSITLASMHGDLSTMKDGMIVALLFGAFSTIYTAFGEPAKFDVPSIPIWMLVETTIGIFQFGIFGVMLGTIHNRLSH